MKTTDEALLKNILAKFNPMALTADDKPAYYVRLSQNASDALYRDEHITNIPSRLCHHEKPECHWGTGVYLVKEDGFLKLLESDFDTSD